MFLFEYVKKRRLPERRLNRKVELFYIGTRTSSKRPAQNFLGLFLKTFTLTTHLLLSGESLYTNTPVK